MADTDKLFSCKSYKEFNDVLKTIDRKFEIMELVWRDEKNFEAKFRTQIPRNDDNFNALCDEWVDLFSEVTNTVWAKKISNTGPKIKFRKQYQCWTHGGKIVQKDLLFDSRRCKGTLDMKVLNDNPLSRRKNKHFRMGLNVVVKINMVHLHPVDPNEPYSFYVHLCEPQEKAPKPYIQSNDRLPQLVAEMVQKGLNTTKKLAKKKQNEMLDSNEKILEANGIQKIIESTCSPKLIFQKNVDKLINVKLSQNNELTHQNSVPMKNEKDIFIKVLDNSLIKSESRKNMGESVSILSNYSPDMKSDSTQTITLQNLIPLQNMETIKIDQLQPYSQLVLTPQLDLNDQLYMFDTQVIPLGHNFNSHFVPLHNPTQFL